MSKKNKSNKFTKPNVKVSNAKASSNEPSSFSFSKILEKLILPLVLLIGVWLFNYAFEKKLMMVGDDTDYYALGKALYEGKGYVNNLTPEMKQHTHFPPGFPYYLSLVMIFAKSVLAIKKASILIYLITLFCLYRIYDNIVDNKWFAAAAVLFTAANPLILMYSNALMSEMLFICLSSLAILLFISIKDNKIFYKQASFYFTILALAAAYYTRSVGIVFIASFFFYDLVRKQWLRAVAILSGTVLLLLPWQIRNSRLGAASYIDSILMKNPYDKALGKMDSLDLWMERITMNFKRHYAVEVPNLLNPLVRLVKNDDITTSHWMWGTAFILLTIWGFISLKKHKWLLLAIFGSTMTIMLVYPEVWSGNRFIVHLVPVLTFVILHGIYHLGLKYLKAPKTRLKFILPLLFLPVLFIYKTPLAEMHLRGISDKFPASFENFFEANRWLNANAVDTSLVASRKSSISYLYSNLFSIQFPSTMDKSRMLKTFNDRKVTHVIVDALGYASTGKNLVPVINSEPDKFKKVFETAEPVTYVFEYHKELGYNGDLVDNLKDGKGTYHWANGAKYEGDWVKDKRTGKGLLFLADGNRYEGQFKEDTFEGKGTYYNKDNKVLFSGNWKNNQPLR
jgi:hypothetical protein